MSSRVHCVLIFIIGINLLPRSNIVDLGPDSDIESLYST